MTIFVTDDIGCVDSTEIFVDSGTDPTILDIEITNATHGQADGLVEVFVEGGAPPYVYSLDEIIYYQSPVFTNLPPGPYAMTIRDGNGCIL
ncbi:MAG: hypothetical protein SH808_05635 [Saprospiraceae bacterium]|nr:hypothetical protein [Saprospiraceae bacterium]